MDWACGVEMRGEFGNNNMVLKFKSRFVPKHMGLKCGKRCNVGSELSSSFERGIEMR